jgi:hypothetical protein
MNSIITNFYNQETDILDEDKLMFFLE